MATILALLYILAVLAPSFLIIAWAVHQRWGARALWTTWAIVIPLVGGACTYKLSGWAWGAPDAGVRTIYYAFVATAALGVPLAVGALVLARAPRIRITRDVVRMQIGGIARLIGGAWLATLASAPLAAALVVVVDLVYAAVGS